MVFFAEEESTVRDPTGRNTKKLLLVLFVVRDHYYHHYAIIPTWLILSILSDFSYY